MASVVGKWSGWGFVNFRATVHKGTEKVYGEFFNAGDIIGVRLDLDQGTFGLSCAVSGVSVVRVVGVQALDIVCEYVCPCFLPSDMCECT